MQPQTPETETARLVSLRMASLYERLRALGDAAGPLCADDVAVVARQAAQALRQAEASLTEARRALSQERLRPAMAGDATATPQEAARFAREELSEQTSRLAEVGGWSLDLATGTLSWTNETYRIHRLDPATPVTVEQAIGFYTPESQPLIRGAIARALETNSGWDVELAMQRADGSPMWARAIGAVASIDGEPRRLSGVIQDITETMTRRLALDEANARIALATESSGICIWDWNLLTDHIVWAPQMFTLYGLPHAESTVVFAHWLSMLHPEDRNDVLDDLQAAINGNATYSGEFRIIRADGVMRYVRGQARVVRNAAGLPVRMLGANWDITESRKLAARLADQHELLRVTLRSIGDGVITTDADGLVQWLNPVAERLTGWSSAEAEGMALETVFNIRDDTTGRPGANPVQACLQEGHVVGLGHDTVLMRRGGGECGVEDSAAPIRNDRGDVLGAVLVFHDVSEQRRLSGEMSYRASHDALTGLVNRSEFETRLGWLLHMAKSDKSENAVLYIDLDAFKIINDTCGHAAGDQVLRQMAKLLGEIVRASDTLARLGGDEFAIILDNCSETSALRLAERICERMENFRFMFQDRRFRIGASIGLVPVDERWSTTEAIMQAADISCYAAKEAGRNRVHRWCDSDQSIHARHGEMQWTGRIEHALEEDRFELFAQRIEPLDHTHDGIHAEILLRLRDTDGTLIGPTAFLPAAERYHLAPRIDRWVLNRALNWMRNLPPARPGITDTICINLSGQSVGDPAFHCWANERLIEAGAAVCARLCLEITETVAITNLADAARFVDKVRVLGVRVALDDFGAGAASFGYLKHLPVNYLKIDGQFIRDLVSDRLDEASVRCFADVARVAGLLTVAECVDHPDTLSKLRAMGIDFAQGFLMNYPAPIDELLKTPDLKTSGGGERRRLIGEPAGP